MSWSFARRLMLPIVLAVIAFSAHVVLAQVEPETEYPEPVAGPVSLARLTHAAETIVLGRVIDAQSWTARSAIPPNIRPHLSDLKVVTFEVIDVFRGKTKPKAILRARQIDYGGPPLTAGDQFVWFLAAVDRGSRDGLPVAMYAGSFRVAEDPRHGLVAETRFANQGLWDRSFTLWDVYPRDAVEGVLRNSAATPEDDERTQRLMAWGEAQGSARPIPVDLLEALSAVRVSFRAGELH